MEEKTSDPNDLAFIRVATPQLKIMVSTHKRTLTDGKYLALIEDIRKVFEEYSAVLAEYHPGASRALAAYRLLGKSFDQTTMMNSTCFKGCGGCCHLEVEITRDEGELLAQIVDDGFEINRKRLAIQAARGRKSLDWRPMLQEDNRCVFLGADQTCQIYESRPLVCRKVLMASDPSECSKENGNPTPLLIPLAEILLSAALSQPGNTYSSLSKGLSAGLSKSHATQSANQQEKAIVPENL